LNAIMYVKLTTDKAGSRRIEQIKKYERLTGN